MTQHKENGQKLQVLGIIPARGGSKGIPRKNIRSLAGKPLLHYMLSAALASKRLSHVVVSSDDAEILEIARNIGGESVVLTRPDELAQDTSLDAPMLQHAVEEIEKRENVRFDYVVQLHATSPFFTAEHIDNAIDMLVNHDTADSAVSVYRLANMHPRKLKRIDNGKLESYIPEYTEESVVRRQDLDPVYKRNAGLYAAKRHVVMDEGRVWGDHCLAYEMPEAESFDVDTLFDFQIADLLMRDKYNNSEEK